MGFLIDTNVLSELRKGSKMNENVRKWFRHGIELLRRRDANAALRLDIWLATVQKNFCDQILPITNEISEQWGHFGVPDPVSVIDGLMAATAMIHGHILVTRNVRDIEQTGVNFINPFNPKNCN